MKLLKIADQCNQNEINSFYKILNEIISQMDEKIELEKNTDAEHYVRTFNNDYIYKEYRKRIQLALNQSLLLDLVTDIFIKDGNCIMSRDWFNELFKGEIANLLEMVKEFGELFEGNAKVMDVDAGRVRDYRIFRACVNTAFHNDEISARDAKISLDELSVLQTLRRSLGLSNEETRAIYFLEVGVKDLKQIDIDDIIGLAKNSGIIFNTNSRKNIVVPDEIVKILRDIKGIPLPDKFTRRILKVLPDKRINRLKKHHGIKEIERSQKIEKIIDQGIDIYAILGNEIFEVDEKVPARMEYIKGMIENDLEIHLSSIGRTLNERIGILVNYFIDQDNDSNLGITRDGYDMLMRELIQFDGKIEEAIKGEFQIQPNVKLTAETLLDYSIRPRDILYLLPKETLTGFCDSKSLSCRGKNRVNVILNSYVNSESMYLQNYTLLAHNDIPNLRNQGITSMDIGLEFEKATKRIFAGLGFHVNEELRALKNSGKEKADIVLYLGDDRVIIVECKASREKYSNYSTISRQLNSYYKHYSNHGLTVEKCFLVSGTFTDELIKEADKFYDFDVTLIEAETLINVHDEFKASGRREFPYRLFKTGLLSEKNVVGALRK